MISDWHLEIRTIELIASIGRVRQKGLELAGGKDFVCTRPHEQGQRFVLWGLKKNKIVTQEKHIVYFTRNLLNMQYSQKRADHQISMVHFLDRGSIRLLWEFWLACGFKVGFPRVLQTQFSLIHSVEQSHHKQLTCWVLNGWSVCAGALLKLFL